MNNLYSKIYNAINEGIQKALLIDPEQNDVSINYSYHKINNNADIISYYVREILKGNDIKDNYDNILQCAQHGQIYKIKNFKELHQLYYCLENYITDIELNWLDTSNVIELLCSNLKKIPLHYYNGSQDVNFIIIKGSECSHDVILHKDLLIKMDLKWNDYIAEIGYWKDPEHISNTFIEKDCRDTINDASNDYNGYEHTWENADIKGRNRSINKKDYPVLFYVQQEINLSGVKAYLPSTGELLFLLNNQKLINSILKIIGGVQLNLFKKDNINGWWTSTEKDWNYVYCLIDNKIKDHTKQLGHKIGTLPLFVY